MRGQIIFTNAHQKTDLTWEILIGLAKDKKEAGTKDGVQFDRQEMVGIIRYWLLRKETIQRTRIEKASLKSAILLLTDT